MKLNPAEKFFYDHAGWSYDPKTQTPDEGRAEGAISLAEAESIAQRKVALREWMYEWKEDWDIGSHGEYYGKGSVYEDHEPETCEWCALYDIGQGHEPKIIASLGCIDDATPDSRRVIEAELALEAL